MSIRLLAQSRNRGLYLEVAQTAAALLAAEDVADHWDEPSALADFSVRGLAGHLAGQIFFLPAMLAEPIPAEPVIDIEDYYARVEWIGTALDTPFNQRIRTGGEQDAAGGPADLAARVAACVAELRTTLPGEPGRPVRRPTWGAWSISFDDFVTSRMLELLIHSDDLACSVGVPTPEFPAEAVQTVVDLLSRISLRRHGSTAVLRALSRAERAPASISAL
ncbi:maleylpyruvate isomerase N-terminal domain-containing protein [Actinospica robiniae]|uniref:maleylpyruvate isomerase N-terminal domain-containing protein n=1 Tax=Actinospica robiniae TaxID=304901 RepID=UPI000411EAF3|nr:maleylpyruvate isomerase N-terminal domain-containing protein [Actinospica robiniae]